MSINLQALSQLTNHIKGIDMPEKKDSSKLPRETNGPVVKTGPTAGENRSRNSNGQWRAKRSDAGKQKGE